MRSLWGKAPFQLQMREVPTPEPGPGEVMVKVAACGICGTDLHFLRHNEDWTPLGHEVVGTIAAVGPYVNRWRGGEAVIIENHTGCGVCEQCKNGRALYCQNLTTYMEDRAGFADYLRVGGSGAGDRAAAHTAFGFRDRPLRGHHRLHRHRVRGGGKVTFDANAFHFKKLQRW